MLSAYKKTIDEYWKKLHTSVKYSDVGDSDDRVYAVTVMGDGSVNEHTIHGYNCHGMLGKRVGVDSLFTLTAFNSVWYEKYNMCSKVANKEWIKWVLNDSPYSAAFLTKSVTTALTKGVITTSEVGGDMMVGGLHLYRNMWESRTATYMKLWWELVRKGMDPHYAYILSHRFQKVGRGWRMYALSSDDSVDLSYMSVENMKRFKMHAPYNSRQPYNVSPHYEGVWRMYCWKGNGIVYDMMRGIPKDMNVEIGWSTVKATSNKRLVSSLIKIYNEIQEHKL